MNWHSSGDDDGEAWAWRNLLLAAALAPLTLPFVLDLARGLLSGGGR